MSVIKVSDGKGKKGAGGPETFIELPASMYVAKVVSIVHRPEMKDFDGKVTVGKWQWLFEVAEGKYVSARASGFTKATMHQDGKTRKWLNSFYEPLKPGDDIDPLVDLVDKYCTILVKKGGVRDDGKHWNNVVEVAFNAEHHDLMKPLIPAQVSEKEKAAKDAPPFAQADSLPVAASSELQDSDFQF